MPGGNPSICGGADYGNAVLVKGPLSETMVLDLTVGEETEPIIVPCVKTYTQSRANWACSVHLYWNDATLREQEAASSFYAPGVGDGGSGIFIEADATDRDHFVATPCGDGRACCRGGEATYENSKIDYLFLSERHFKNAKADGGGRCRASPRCRGSPMLRSGSLLRLATHGTAHRSLIRPDPKDTP
ncbi:hypothetical protein [Streptomyces sp. RerS4]|uniref:hypothetical protein n=1 Tax=Streptomyces sp. RerS4 TaxID=2942449 RepID=UPI00201C7357|nr:hypothetical protein [Streptomyces sp. RerS4]UQW99348.1 hypothetical protein M4D82_01520 [Streptomyces sp. RerS4]